MNIGELRQEAEWQVRRLAAKHGYADHIIQIRIKKRKTRKCLTPKYVIEFMCDYYQLSIDFVLSKTRKANIVEVRQIIQYFLYKYCQLGTVTIGNLTKRDHSTVIYSCQRVTDLMATEREFSDKILNLEHELLKGVTKYKRIIN